MEENQPPSNRSKIFFDSANGVVQILRDQPPEHCILKIDAFSKLQGALSESKTNRIDSTEFKAGGYTWVLSVYPKGNKEEDGSDHLSLYVALIDKLQSCISLNASLRFFIYDQIRGNYLTFLDVRDKRYDALKTEWGIPKLLPVDSFTNACNGFLVNDCCVFGAEILVRNGQVKRSILSHLEAKSERSYTWKIEDFSNLLNNRLESPTQKNSNPLPIPHHPLPGNPIPGAPSPVKDSSVHPLPGTSPPQRTPPSFPPP
ncbi:Ubiquitin carboxyl-terminal hydrolase 12 [Bienertia sinuspersici]